MVMDHKALVVLEQIVTCASAQVCNGRDAWPPPSRELFSRPFYHVWWCVMTKSHVVLGKDAYNLFNLQLCPHFVLCFTI